MTTNVMAGAERIEEVPEATRGCAAGDQAGGMERPAAGRGGRRAPRARQAHRNRRAGAAGPRQPPWRELERTLSWWDAEYRRQAPEPVG